MHEHLFTIPPVDSVRPPRALQTYVHIPPEDEEELPVRKPSSPRFARGAAWLTIAFRVASGVFILAAGLLLFLVMVRGAKLYTVLSGSMEPTFPVGSVALVFPQQSTTPTYQVGDVLTFRGNGSVLITHRVVGARVHDNAVLYRMKGDANDMPDMEEISHARVVGRAVVALPALGYFLKFLHTYTGFALCILFPATFLILNELRIMRRVWKELPLRQRRLLPVGVFAGIVAIAGGIGVTRGLFSDTAALGPTTVTVGAASPSPSPSAEPSPTPTAEPSPTPTASPCVLGDIDVEAHNEHTGEGSTNTNDVIIHQECTQTETQETNITNTVAADANTGGNTASGNTNGGSITTGNASIGLMITNE